MYFSQKKRFHDIECLHSRKSSLSCLCVFSGVLQKHKWENAMTLDKSSWGFRREMDLGSVLSNHDLLTLLAETVR